MKTMCKFKTLLHAAAIVTFGTLQCAGAGGLNIDHPYGGMIEGWSIGYSKLVNGCVATESFSDQTTMWLGLGDSRIGAYLAFSNPKWNWIKVGQTYELNLDAMPYGHWRGNFVGIQSDKWRGFASLGLNVGFQYDISRAYALVVDFGPAYARLPYEPTREEYTLNGADAALQAVRECQSQRGMSTILPDPREGGSLGAPPKESGVGGGTGFFISTDGGILTNNHVVERCSSVQISVGGPALHEAQVKGTDKENDLALVYSDLKPTAVPELRTGVASGEAVAIYGFPLPGILAQSGVFTAGNVSALAGLGGDTTKLQMSSPLQPGNSGGPLLDQSGNVVGVAAARLIGQLIENVNFAIKAEVAISFLKANNAQPNTAASTTPIGPSRNR